MLTRNEGAGGNPADGGAPVLDPTTEPSGAVTLSDGEAQIEAATRLLEEGLIQEAQSLLRRIPFMGRNRDEIVALTDKACALDSEFWHFASNGNRARDTRDWGGAEWQYWQAVSLYPFNADYLIQYGHVLREQDKFLDAEIPYRSALALGSDPLHVVEYLNMALYGQGLPPVSIKNRRKRNLSAGDEAPTRFDIETLARLLWGGGDVSSWDVALMLRSCATCDAAAAAMVDNPRFTAANPVFLKLLAKTRLPETDRA